MVVGNEISRPKRTPVANVNKRTNPMDWSDCHWKKRINTWVEFCRENTTAMLAMNRAKRVRNLMGWVLFKAYEWGGLGRHALEKVTTMILYYVFSGLRWHYHYELRGNGEIEF